MAANIENTFDYDSVSEALVALIKYECLEKIDFRQCDLSSVTFVTFYLLFFESLHVYTKTLPIGIFN